MLMLEVVRPRDDLLSKRTTPYSAGKTHVFKQANHSNASDEKLHVQPIAIGNIWHSSCQRSRSRLVKPARLEQGVAALLLLIKNGCSCA
jgi:hypothetical protein